MRCHADGRAGIAGFTLIEALVAIVVVSIAVVGSMEAFHSLARTQTKAHDTELMQRLAFEKYDEEIVLAQTTLSNSSGNFDDRNLQGYTWSMDVTSTSVNDLMAVKVTVSRDTDANMPGAPKGVASGLYYQVQATSGTAGGTPGGTG